MAKTKYRKADLVWKPPLSIESVNDKTIRTYVRTIQPNTHDTKVWYVYKYTYVPTIRLANGTERKGRNDHKECRLLRADIEGMNQKYFKLKWT